MNKTLNARLYVEKKVGFQVEAQDLLDDLNHNLELNINALRLIVVYDIFGIEEGLLEKAKHAVFSEPVTDEVYTEFPLDGLTYFAVEFLPGQFDQRADSAMQCLQLIDPKTTATIRSAKLIIMDGKLSEQDMIKIKKHCINEVEAREKDMSILDDSENVTVADVEVFDTFNTMSPEELDAFRKKLSLAMSFEDIMLIQNYFQTEEKRNPTETEIKMLDTYWSDHCRHTTFETQLDNITFTPSKFNDQLQEAFYQYIQIRNNVHGGRKPITLMDMATICGKNERKLGNLDDMEVSEENNACSVYVDVDVDGKIEKWLLMFKNETHNHPTEIEPFGGAATCVGGAIRDPLSGRSYVYQAMRVTGAGNINEPVSQTMEGKLPQRVISKSAAAGYSSYGNQIGLATTHVREIYHEGYKAKRLEIGAVVGAVPADGVRREQPQPGDIIIMFGGRTGRDGIGGATGSSKEHTETSLEVCAAEVQKGNAPEERKIQHLFRKPEVTRLIKKSNDFGAGGVSVAIGELADGLLINLDAVKTKYKGLNGTELAISESQERMSVVVDPKDVDQFFEYCRQENIEATIIAKVTDNNRLTIQWRGKNIVDLSRDFINTNGYRQRTDVVIPKIEGDFPERVPETPANQSITTESVTKHLASPNVASQKGLIEMFDSTIGASTVLMPFGGKHQLTESQAGVQKLPVLHGHTNTASILAFGYNPYIASFSPFHGAMYAVLESMAKIVAVGGNYRKIRFTFQEYFEKLGKDTTKWGKPFSALLGAIYMQNAFHLPSIGGKDSMSGTFKNLNVPPTLVSFGIVTEKADKVISPEFKQKGNHIYLINNVIDDNHRPSVERVKQIFDYVHEQIHAGKIISCYTLQFGGIIEALCKMSFGNDLGFDIHTNLPVFDYGYGSFVVETNEKLDLEYAIELGCVSDKFIINGIEIDKAKCLAAWRGTYDAIYPEVKINSESMPKVEAQNAKVVRRELHPPKTDKVKVIIPVFPGSNCDYDTAKAFKDAGAEPEIFVFRNLNEKEINDSIDELSQKIDNAHILALCGGFSSGDEPDGSGKFIANVLNNEKVKAAIERLLDRDCLILGICNGFQALVKSGLLPYGKIGQVTAESPTLYRNDINRHLSHITKTVVASNHSPWLNSFKEGEVHRVAISHGEGKFVVSEKMAQELFANGQVAFQYCDFEGHASMNKYDNPNGSSYAIEGIVSDCGRILGKMGHSERKGENLYKNIPGNKTQDIFSNAVRYFQCAN
ncbi:MAG: phosphoribosylformylglycinamidine synthase [Bacteroidetes bacterium]|nr:phosphoribosylformylglycinamidine synthase [Bacteroidota bacterium]